ncbi:MAG: FAD-binding oxidoreductase [Woeseiaceae bacterium]|nr:FAD-binding oxidoreductase [Woeseiaceae bacterium]
MARAFHDNLYRFDAAQPSYWEATASDRRMPAAPLGGAESCDVAVIGGGYTGLSTALHLARDFGVDVRVLEAGPIGWGASGRNGGFCCIGGTGVHRRELVRLAGLEAAREYLAAQAGAVGLVRDLITAERIDCETNGDAELEIAHTPRAFRRLEADHALLTGVLGRQAELVGAAECRARFYDSTETHGGLVTRPAFALHPLKYCLGLAAAAEKHGVRLHGNSEVLEWVRAGGRHRLATRGGTLAADRVVFATNGFMPEDLNPAFFGRTIPVLSAIIVTRPLTADELAAQGWRTGDPAINSRRILNYFRLLPDGRFLLGGRGEVTGAPAREQETYRWLAATLGRVWPAWRDVRVDYRWHGLICTTASLCPTLGRLDEDPSVFFAFGYHGNGVNTATWAGGQLAEWLGTGRAPPGLPAIVSGLSRRYPLPALRRSYLRLGLFISRQLDRWY